MCIQTSPAVVAWNSVVRADCRAPSGHEGIGAPPWDCSRPRPVMLETTSLFASARAEGSTGNSNNTKHSKTSSDNYNNSLRSHLGSRWDALRGGAEGSGRAAPWGLTSPRTSRRPRTRGTAWCRQWGGRRGRRPPAAPASAIRRARRLRRDAASWSSRRLRRGQSRCRRFAWCASLLCSRLREGMMMSRFPAALLGS